MRFTLALVASVVLAQAVYAEGSASHSHHHHSASDEYRGSSSVAPAANSALDFEGAMNFQKRSASEEPFASSSADDSEYSSSLDFDYSLGEDPASSTSAFEEIENFYRRSLSDDPYASLSSQESEASSSYYAAPDIELDYRKRELSSEASIPSDEDYSVSSSVDASSPEPTGTSESASFAYDAAYHSELAFELEKRGIVDFFKNLFGGEEASASEVEEASAVPDAYSIAAHSAAESASASVHDVATKAHAAASHAAAEASSKVDSAFAAGHGLDKRDEDVEPASSVNEATSSVADFDPYESVDPLLRTNRAAKAAQKNVASRSSAAASSSAVAALKKKRRDLSGYYSNAGHVVFGSEDAQSDTASTAEPEESYGEAGHVVFGAGPTSSSDEYEEGAQTTAVPEDEEDQTTVAPEDESEASSTTDLSSAEPEITPAPHHGKSKVHYKRDSESASSASSSSDEYAFLDHNVDSLLEGRDIDEESSQSSSAASSSDEYGFLDSDINPLLERRQEEAAQTTDAVSSVQDAAAVETSASSVEGEQSEEELNQMFEALLEQMENESAKDEVKENAQENFWIDDASAEDSFKGYDWKNLE